MTMFGKYAKENLVHNLEKNPEVSFGFHYPTSDDESKMEHFMRNRPSDSEIWILEIALLFEETNLGEEEGESYLDKSMPVGVRQRLVGDMPYELLFELAQAIHGFAERWGAKEVEEEEK